MMHLASLPLFSIMTLFIFPFGLLRLPISSLGLNFQSQSRQIHKANFAFRASRASRAFHAISSISSSVGFQNETEKKSSGYSKVTLTDEQNELLSKWREHPAINPILTFPTVLVPSEYLQRWIQDRRLEPYLAKPSNCNFLNQVHPRIKLVQEYNDTHKLLLLLKDEDNDRTKKSPNSISLKALEKMDVGDEPTLNFGPDIEIKISFQQLSFGYILSRLLPVSPPSAYEQIGHVAHFNLKAHHAPYAELIGQVLRETNSGIDTVVTKVGEVKGKYRTYDLEVLAGPNDFDTTVMEHGLPIRLNVADCYWSTRLSGERQELIQDIESSPKGGNKSLIIADVFCGVGAVCLLLAKGNENYKILANDWNEKAIAFLRDSIALNGLDKNKQFKLSSGDSYDYMIELGTDLSPEEIPDHILMNYPLEAPSFLGSLRWWSSDNVKAKYDKTRRYPRFHVYTFARRSSREINDEEEIAVNLIANELLPEMGALDTLRYRRRELDEDFDADVKSRLVRDVAPGKVVVCVSFLLTPTLIRFMQGDFETT